MLGFLVWGILMLGFGHDILGSILGLVTFGSFDLAAGLLLRWRDKQFWRLSYELAKSDGGPFLLFLRSFRRKSLYAPTFLQQGYPGTGMAGVHVPFDSFPISYGMAVLGRTLQAINSLAEQLECRIVVVGSGGLEVPDILSLDRFVVIEASEDRWRAIVQTLGQSASAILIIPESSKGVMTELRLLIRDQLHKTFVYVPATNGAERRNAQELRWRALGKELATEGIRLPDYGPAGFAYLPEADLSVKVSWELSEFAGAIRELIDHSAASSDEVAAGIMKAESKGGRSL